MFLKKKHSPNPLKNMENKYLTRNVIIKNSKYSETGAEYYFKNEYGTVGILTDGLTPADFRAIADHLESCSKDDPILYGGELPELEVDDYGIQINDLKISGITRKQLKSLYEQIKKTLD